MSFEKGQQVQATAYVETHLVGWDDPGILTKEGTRWTRAGSALVERVYEPDGESKDRKCLYRVVFPKTLDGIVVGYSYRATGYWKRGTPYNPYDFGDDYEPPCLNEDKRHVVVMVQPLHTKRWLKPWPCLEEDLAVARETVEAKLL